MTRGFIELTDTEVLTTYTTKPDRYALGNIGWCNMNGIIGQFVFSRNVQGGAFIVGEVLQMIDTDLAGNTKSISNVYTTATVAEKALVKLNNEVASPDLAADYHAGALLGVTVGTGIKQLAQVVGHDATSTSKVSYRIGKNFATALAATDDIVVVPHSLCIKSREVLSMVSGVAPVAVADGAYFWRQVAGWCFVNITSATTIPAAQYKSAEINASATDGEATFGAADEEFDTLTDPFGICVAKVGGANTAGLCIIRTKFAI